MAAWLTVDDLNNLVGSERVLQLLDDDLDGIVDTDPLANILTAAEAEAYSRMMRSWSTTAIVSLAGSDPAFVMHCAYVALEFASERRPAFCGDEGKGAYWVQYERAIAYFEALSKGKARSIGESTAGAGSNIGGNLRPTTTAKQATSFVFATSEENPSGSGGY